MCRLSDSCPVAQSWSTSSNQRYSYVDVVAAGVLGRSFSSISGFVPSTNITRKFVSIIMSIRMLMLLYVSIG